MQQQQQWTFENTFASVPIRPPPPHSAPPWTPSPAATPTSARVPAQVRDYTTWTAQEEGVLINLMIDSLTDALNNTPGVEGPKPMSAVKRGGPGNERWAHYDSMARIVGRDSTIIPPVVIDSMAERFVRVRRRDDADSDDDNVDEPEQEDEQEQQQEQRGNSRKVDDDKDDERHMSNLGNAMKLCLMSLGTWVESERSRQEDNRRHSEFLAVLSSFRAESNTTSTSNDNDNTTSTDNTTSNN
ncbi:hypothetical protein BC941DRAFT_519502 [Chlamydoabsidia padenii]|nr:hypothetical protein BC941DRAFT_519502 [Chlamydoabsidia padenii]